MCLWQNSSNISRMTKICLWRKRLVSVWERTIHSELAGLNDIHSFWLVQWQGDLCMNKQSNSSLITERTSLIMAAPCILPSAEVVERAHAGLSFCWHVEKPEYLKLLDISPCQESAKRMTAERCGASFSLLSFKNQEAFNFLDLVESQLKEKRKISPSVC